MSALDQALARYHAAVAELRDAEKSLHHLTGLLMPPSSPVDLQRIQEVVSIYFRFPLHVLWSRQRHEPLATARNLAMALSLELTGQHVGVVCAAYHRSRGCATAAVKTVAGRCDTEPTFRALYNDLKARC